MVAITISIIPKYFVIVSFSFEHSEENLLSYFSIVSNFLHQQNIFLHPLCVYLYFQIFIFINLLLRAENKIFEYHGNCLRMLDPMEK